MPNVQIPLMVDSNIDSGLIERWPQGSNSSMVDSNVLSTRNT